MKNILRTLSFFALTAILIMSSCSDSFDSLLVEEQTAGNANLRVIIGDENDARTLFPSPSQFTGYRLDCIKGSEKVTKNAGTNTNSVDMELTPGTWTITVTGLVGTKDAVYGSSLVEIELGKTATVKIVLNQNVSETPGVFHYSLKFPNLDSKELDDSYTTATFTITPENPNYGTVTYNLKQWVNKNSSPYSFTGDLELPPGDYTMDIALVSARIITDNYNRNYPASVYRKEAVHIYSNMVTSTPDYVFLDRDFTANLYFQGTVTFIDHTDKNYQLVEIELSTDTNSIIPIIPESLIISYSYWELSINAKNVNSSSHNVNTSGNLYFRAVYKDEASDSTKNGKWLAYSIGNIHGTPSNISLSDDLYVFPAPSSVNAVTQSSSSINISWEDVSGANSYHIYRNDSYIATVNNNNTSYTDTGLTMGAQYSYQVCAVNNSSFEGEKSAPVSATTSTLSAPSGVNAVAQGSTSISISWYSVIDASYYRIYRNGSLYTTTPNTSYTDTSLTANTQYSYQVSAVNSSGDEGNKSSSVNATTLLSAPSWVTAEEQNSTTIMISWGAVSGANSYKIYRNGSFYTTTTNTSYTNTVAAGTGAQYSYQVSAVNTSSVEGEKSDPVSTTGLLSTPSGVSAVAQDSTSIMINWNSVSNASYYYIYRDGNYIDMAYNTYYTDYGLVAGTQYSYQVSAVNNSSVEGNKSSSASATTLSSTGTLPAPSGVSATAQDSSSIMISWNSVSDASYYKIYRDNYYIDTAYNTYYTDYGLVAGTQYSYQVSAVNNSSVEGNKSAPVNGIPYDVNSVIGLVTYSWYDNTLSAGEYHYYKFYANDVYTTYYIEGNDSDTGLGKTCDIRVLVFREDDNTELINSDIGSSTPGFSITSDGWIIIRVSGYSSTSSGTYAIQYNQP
jgi:fibronectin type 3 domain-containing protein